MNVARSARSAALAGIAFLLAACAPDSGPDAGADLGPTSSPSTPSTSAPSPSTPTTAAVPTDWLTAVQRGISLASYQPRPLGDGFVASNRAQRLRATATPNGVTLADPDGSWSGSVRLQAWGPPGDLAPAPSATPALGPCFDATLDVDGRCVPRLDLIRPGITEWWENRADGLEQGWTIHASPGTGDLVLALAIDGLTATLASPTALHLHGPDVTLRYSGLHVTDADGVTLPAHFARADDAHHIVIDAAGAAFPIDVDPLITNTAWAWEGSTYNTAVGTEVSGLGDINGDGYGDIAVAAPTSGFGTVWVFHGSSAGPSWFADWSETGWTGSQFFGWSIDAAGDVNGDGYGDVIIGAPDCISATCSSNTAGTAFVWHGSALGLGASPAWGGSGSGARGRFGISVAGAGDVNEDGYADVVVGSPGRASSKGRFEIFHGTSGGLQSSAAVQVDGVDTAEELGSRVVGLGDFNGDGYGDVAASSPGYYYASGRVQVHLGSASGLTATPAFSLTQGFLGAFGAGLADAGDVNADGYADLLVGAPNANSSGNAYLYYGNSAATTPTVALTVAGLPGDELGADVAGLGDVNGDGFADFAIGAPYADTPTDGGDVEVYLGSDTAPVHQATLSTTQTSARFGTSVAAAGDVDGDGYADLLVGAPGWDGSVWENVGVAELFIGSPAGLTTAADWSTTSNNAGAEQGASVAGAGDVNGDGYDDVLVGAPLFDNGQTDEGRVWYFAGGASGVATTAAATFEPNWIGARLGVVAGAGDVNGDGYEDILLGAPGFNADRGAVSLHLGSSAGPNAVASWVAQGTPGSELGAGLAGAGDVNGDGFADFLMGAPAYTNGQTEEGAAVLVLGSDGALSPGGDWLLEGNQSFAELGCSVAGLRDVNRDGFDDVAIAACAHDGSFVDEGRVAVFHGSSEGLGSTPDLTLLGGQADAEFGASVAGAGDVDGDGDDELLVGAPGWGTGNNADAGQATLFLGSTGGLAATPSVTWTGTAGAELGTSVAGIGDVNGDGFGDIALGAPQGVGTGIVGTSGPPGLAQVHLGGAAGPGSGADWTSSSTQGGAEHGAAVAAAGDVNGDGFDDLLVGAPGFDDGQSDEGRVQLFSGGGGDGTGWGTSPRPRATSGTTLLPPGGRASSNTVTLRADLRPIRGAGDVRLEVEVKTLGTPFDGTGTQLSLPAFSWASGIERSVNVTVADEARVHWRARMVTDRTEGHEVLFGRWMYGGRGGSAQGSHLVGPCAADLDGDGACDSTDPDIDGDGDPNATDCDDADPAVYTGAPELCDGVDNDCDVSVDEDFDDDGDGFYDDDASFGCATTWPGQLDCDDSDPAVNPDAAEVCNGVDDDCNGFIDDVAGGLPAWYADSDGDTYGSPAVVTLSCIQPTGTVADNTDCDDTDAAVHPGAVEACDGVDTNCDGTVPSTETDDDGDGYNECAGLDCDDTNPTVHPVASELCDGLDTNCDGSIPADETDADADSWRICDGDCDDTRPNVHPSLSEACDGWDTDCNASTTLPTEVDGDGDSYYPCTYVSSGGNPAFAGGDCDDTDLLINPGAVEVCDGGVDNDCDPSTIEGSDADGDGFDTCTDCDDTDPLVFPGAPEICDGNDSDCSGGPGSTETDADTDGFVACTFASGASPPAGLGDGDCDDAAPTVYPGAPEQCDGLDTNCDGVLPSNEADADADGFSSCDGDCDDAEPLRFPGNPEVCDGLDNDCNGTLPGDEQDPDGDGVLACAGDCNDGNANVYPGATELCDGLDNDCDGTVPGDELDADADTVSVCDGDCDDTNPLVNPKAAESCDGVDTNCDGTLPANESDADADGIWPCNGDCDDSQATVFTGAPELCDALDNDCDASVDEDFDVDGDGAFDASDAGCASTYGGASDCDDTDPAVGPGSPEVCNGLDDDCDGAADEDFDLDGDGSLEADACSAIGGDDCDDTDSSVYPGAAEACDGADNDCDGSVDESFDADGDGAFDGADPGCAAVYGVGADCDDADATILPGAPEVCDGLDQDCDGVVPATETDGDGDGWVECAAPLAGHVGAPIGGGDCNDAAGNVFPGAPELCNAVDDDCDADVDEDFDADGDGAYDGAVAFCVATWGAGVDCDDSDAAVFPGADESCNTTDDDCDGLVDEDFDADADAWTTCGGDCDDGDPNINPGMTEDCTTAWDDNCDGVTTATDGDGDGVDTCSGDCDDGDAAIYPGAPEACDGVDQDCDGTVDNGFDTDGDGVTSCGGDCDDADPAIHPGAPEVCDGVDQDCDTELDEAFDLDGDGFFDGTNPDCAAAWVDTDCDDGNPLISPAAAELCNAADEDCDGLVDEDFDADGDGAFDGSNPGCAANYGALADCDDADPTTFGGAPELCDGLDNDCEGSISGTETDDDGDGWVECAAPEVNHVGAPAGGGDCDDASATVFPGASELCNGVDDDCDGSADEDFDVDGDGYADGDDPLCAALTSADCDDTDASIHPGAPEACNAIDDNCDGVLDEDFDLDGDGWVDGDDAACAAAWGTDVDCDDADPAVFPFNFEDCTNGIDDNCNGLIDEDLDDDGDGVTTCGGDCDDTDPAVHAFATELCNGIDDDCTFAADEPFDADGDGAFDGADPDCAATYGSDADCDDADPTIHPGATEVCDAIDQNCDGVIDEPFDQDGDLHYESTACQGAHSGLDLDCDDTEPSVYVGADELCDDGLDNDCDFLTDGEDPTCAGDDDDSTGDDDDSTGDDDDSTGDDDDSTGDDDDDDSGDDDDSAATWYYPGCLSSCAVGDGAGAPLGMLLLLLSLRTRRRARRGPRGRSGPRCP